MDCRVLLGLLIHEGEVFRGGTQTPGNSNDFFSLVLRFCFVIDFVEERHLHIRLLENPTGSLHSFWKP